MAFARLRQHPSAVAASLASDAIPESVYRSLVAETHEALPTLHRSFKMRQRMLGLPDLVKAPRRFSPEDSAEPMLASVAPLGAAYQRLLRSGGSRHPVPLLEDAGLDTLPWTDAAPDGPARQRCSLSSLAARSPDT